MTYNQNKKFFVFNINNVINIITNSSSELFVLKEESLSIAKEMLQSIVTQDELSDYEELRLLKDCNEDEIAIYIDQYYSTSDYRGSIEAIEGFEIDEMYEQSRWGAMIKDGFIEENKEKIVKAIDPNDNIYVLFSKGENPPYKVMEKLMTIATFHHHLG